MKNRFAPGLSCRLPALRCERWKVALLTVSLWSLALPACAPSSEHAQGEVSANESKAVEAAFSLDYDIYNGESSRAAAVDDSAVTQPENQGNKPSQTRQVVASSASQLPPEFTLDADRYSEEDW